MRDLLVSLPDKIKVAWYRILRWSDLVALSFIDKYLDSRYEERASKVIDFDDLPVLYEYSNFSVVTADSDDDFSISGWDFVFPTSNFDKPIALDDEDVI